MAKNEIEILVTAEVDKALKNINKVQKGTEDTAKKSTSSLGKLSKAWKVFGASVIGVVVVGAFKKLITIASDAQETFSKFDTTFKDVAKQAETVAKSFAKNFGLSELAAKKLLSSTGDLLTGFGFTGKAALEMSKNVNELAVDLGSFQNISTERASSALTKALTGETESLKLLGIVIRQDTKEFKDNVKAIQEAEGITLQQAKSQEILRQSFLQSKNAVGDFQRTQASFANQLKIAKSSIEDQAVSLGSKLLPIATLGLRIFNDLTKQEKSLSQVTDDLVKSSDEYAKITKTLADESKTLTVQERAKLEVRKSELKLQVAENIIKINKLYKEQQNEIPKLQKKQADYNKEQLRYADLIKRINKGEVDRFDDLESGITIDRLKDAQRDFNNALKNGAIANNEIAKKTSEYDDAVKSLAFGLANELITKGDLQGVNAKLLADATKQAQAIRIETQARKDNTGATIENAVKKIATDKQLTDIQKATNEAFKQSDEELLQSKIDNLNTFLETFSLTAEQEKAIVLAREEYERQQLELTNKKRNDNILKAISGAQKIFSYASTIAGNIVDIETNKYNAIDEEDTKAREKQAGRIKKAAEVAKALAITQTVIDTIVGAQRAFSSLAAIPVVGVGLGIAAATAATIAGAVSVAKIKSEPLPAFEQGGISDGGLATVGERGRENVILPQGAQVINHTKTLQSENNNRFSVDNITLPGVTNGQQFFEELQAYQRQYGGF